MRLGKKYTKKQLKSFKNYVYNFMKKQKTV